MKPIEMKEVDGHTEIKVETGFWIFKRVTTYRTNGVRVGVGGYFRWLKLPNKTLVHDALSFRLDAWKRSGV